MPETPVKGGGRMPGMPRENAGMPETRGKPKGKCRNNEEEMPETPGMPIENDALWTFWGPDKV